MPTQDPGQNPKATTGIEGFDRILNGGLPTGEIHLIQGGPGTGKTTVGLQFLLEGAGAGEKVLFITLAQTRVVLGKIAVSHGWSLDGVDVEELTGIDAVHDKADQTLFHTADVELGETTDLIFAAVDRVNPDRVVLDTITSIRLLADSPLRYRRQLLTMRKFFADRPITVLLLDGTEKDAALEDLSHGVIKLERRAPEYGNVRRRLSVNKMRGMTFHGGYHNFRIRTGGLSVYPRLEPNGKDGHANWETMTSGVAGLDAMLGGGIEEGTACLLVGPSGTGKTSVGTLYAYEAAKRGEHAAIFSFDERPRPFSCARKVSAWIYGR